MMTGLVTRLNVMSQLTKQATVLVFSLAMICGVFPHSSVSTVVAQTVATSPCEVTSEDAVKKLSSSVMAVINGSKTSNYYDPNTNMVQVIIQTTTRESAKIVSDEVTNRGGSPIYSFRSINGLLANVPVDKVMNIAKLCVVERITCDHTTQQTASHLETVTGLSNLRSYNSTKNGFSGIDGTGIGIAVLDSGVVKNHKSVLDAGGYSRVKAAVTMLNVRTAVSATSSLTSGFNLTSLSSTYGTYSNLVAETVVASTATNPDYYGHGTFVANIAAGRGVKTSVLEATGIAPNANIIDVKVLDDHGIGRVADAIMGIDWVLYHKDDADKKIRVINMSLAAPSNESWTVDPLCRAVRRATAAGITVVVAAGNTDFQPMAKRSMAASLHLQMIHQ